MNSISPQQQLVNHTVAKVLVRVETVCMNEGEVWSNEEYAALRAYVNYLVFGFPGDYSALRKEWYGRIQLRFASSYLELEQSLKGYEMPAITTKWFKSRLRDERNKIIKTSKTN